MKIYLVKKEKNKIYKSDKMVLALFGKDLLHNDKGAPIVDDGYISITDTKNYWACAFSEKQVGIDAEEISRELKPAVTKKLHPAEAEYLAVLSFGSREWTEEFLSIWTKKESYSKYLGKGLGAGFSKFCVLPGYEMKLETPLYNLKYKNLIFGATEEIEIEEIPYDAPMNKTALEAGADILDMFGCSAKTLSKKLSDRGYSEDDVKEAVEKLVERGFLNDDEYSRSLSQKYEARGYASKRIGYELKKKGVSADTASRWAEEYESGNKERAFNVAEKMALGKEKDEKMKAKIARKLSSLGYNTSLIYDILDKL